MERLRFGTAEPGPRPPTQTGPAHKVAYDPGQQVRSSPAKQLDHEEPITRRADIPRNLRPKSEGQRHEGGGEQTGSGAWLSLEQFIDTSRMRIISNDHQRYSAHEALFLPMPWVGLFALVATVVALYSYWRRPRKKRGRLSVVHSSRGDNDYCAEQQQQQQQQQQRRRRRRRQLQKEAGAVEEQELWSGAGDQSSRMRRNRRRPPIDAVQNGGHDDDDRLWPSGDRHLQRRLEEGVRNGNVGADGDGKVE